MLLTFQFPEQTDPILSAEIELIGVGKERCACWIQGIGCVASTISKLVAVRMIPWANLSYTAQTLIISYGIYDLSLNLCYK
ncbi:hypothetical protein P8452_38709 [Trifolium repens]|nr:hypothetical protein P8452_38709 [Trifolium repens]